jgi:hypothetical protein
MCFSLSYNRILSRIRAKREEERRIREKQLKGDEVQLAVFFNNYYY